MGTTNFDIVDATTLKVGGVAVAPELTQGDHVVDVTAADATTNTATYNQTNVNTIATLATANKAKINEVIAALETAGVLKAS
jgi:hypothetical protein